MSEGRERNIIGAFVDLSNELVDGYDMVELLVLLTENCAQLLDVASASLLLSDGAGVLHLVGSSSDESHDLELFQLQRHEGPCLDCYREGRAVVVPDLAAEEQRWPRFTSAARSAGVRSVHALPMRLRGTMLGAVGLFGEDVGRLDDDDLVLAQALVHVASVAIVNEKSAADRDTIDSQLQRALANRIAVEQAKGVLAHSGGLRMDVAYDVLRRYARDQGHRLSDTARRVANREVLGAEVIQHGRSAGVLH